MITPKQLANYGKNWKNIKHKQSYKQLCRCLKNLHKPELQELSIIDKMRLEHEAAIAKKDRAFQKEIAKSRPMLNSDATLNQIENEASKLAYELAAVVRKAISYQMATTFATKMITQDLGAEGSNLDWPTINDYGRKMATIPVIEALSKHFEISDDKKEMILALMQQRLWGPKAQKPEANPNNQMESLTKQLIESVKTIPNNTKHFGNIEE